MRTSRMCTLNDERDCILSSVRPLSLGSKTSANTRAVGLHEPDRSVPTAAARQQPADGAPARRCRRCGAIRCEGFDRRRNGRRQRDRRAPDSRTGTSAFARVRDDQLRGPARLAPRKRALRPRAGQFHGRLSRQSRDWRRSPTTARCSSTNSARCRCGCRPSSCVFSRPVKFSASGRIEWKDDSTSA